MPLAYDRLAFPCSIDALLSGFAGVERDVAALVASADPAVLTRAPVNGWSAAQIIEHLALIVGIYVGGMEEGIARARPVPGGVAPPVQPGVLSRWFIRQMEPPVRRRFRAPRRIVPAARPDFEAAWAACQRANGMFRDLAERCRSVDPNRSRFPNPLATGIRFTIGTGLALMVAHHRRHACQLERAIAAARG